MWWWIGVGGALLIGVVGFVLGLAAADRPPGTALWAVYDGLSVGETYRPTTLVVFTDPSAAGVEATSRGMWFTGLTAPGDVLDQLATAARAPAVPWVPWDQPP